MIVIIIQCLEPILMREVTSTFQSPSTEPILTFLLNPSSIGPYPECYQPIKFFVIVKVTQVLCSFAREFQCSRPCSFAVIIAPVDFLPEFYYV